MYKDFFGITVSPFSITPDPHFLYMSHGHREALAHLRYALGEGGGFVLLTGEVGTGKTTVCRCLLEQAHDNVNIALVINPKLSALELLATICDELHVEYPPACGRKCLIDRLNAYLLEAHAQGQRTVLIIDEAQNLSRDVLEQVRLLTNLETNQQRLLQIVLLGQPELQALLAQPDLRQLSQRIAARHHLLPLSKAETMAYVRHRLAVAGLEQGVFPSLALEEVFRLTGGTPRTINLICDRAMLGAYAKGVRQVGRDMVREAGRQVFGPAVKSSLGVLPNWLVVGVMAAACVLVAAALWWLDARPAAVPVPFSDSRSSVLEGGRLPDPDLPASLSGSPPEK